MVEQLDEHLVAYCDAGCYYQAGGLRPGGEAEAVIEQTSNPDHRHAQEDAYQSRDLEKVAARNRQHERGQRGNRKAWEEAEPADAYYGANVLAPSARSVNQVISLANADGERGKGSNDRRRQGKDGQENQGRHAQRHLVI